MITIIWFCTDLTGGYLVTFSTRYELILSMLSPLNVYGVLAGYSYINKTFMIQESMLNIY